MTDFYFFLMHLEYPFFSLSACLIVVSPWLSLFRCLVMNGALTASLSAECRVSSAKDIRETRAERGMANKESLTWYIWLSLKCLSSSNKRAEIALTIISLCLFTSMPSFMLWRTVILFPTQTREMFAVRLKQSALIFSCAMHTSNAGSLLYLYVDLRHLLRQNVG